MKFRVLARPMAVFAFASVGALVLLSLVSLAPTSPPVAAQPVAPNAAPGPASPGASPDPSSSATSSAAIEVRATKPVRRDIVRYVTLPGRVQPNQQATLHAKVSGYLESLTVDKGDRVKQGQTLGHIDVPELRADLTRFEATLAVAEGELARISEALAKAPDLVVPQSVDDARAKVEIARADVRRTRTLLGYTRLVAPFAGIVTARHVDPGAFIPAATATNRVAPGADGAAILTLMDFATVRIQVPVPEREAALVRVGQPLDFRVDVLGSRRFESKVARHAYALDPVTQTMLVEADVANPELALRPGMFVTARVGVERHDDVPSLPLAAVLVEKATRSVLVLDGGVARKRLVETGFDDGESIEIVNALDANATVLIPGAARPLDGAPVRVVENP